MKKTIVVLLCILCVILGLSGCSSDSKNATSSVPAKSLAEMGTANFANITHRLSFDYPKTWTNLGEYMGSVGTLNGPAEDNFSTILNIYASTENSDLLKTKKEDLEAAYSEMNGISLTVKSIETEKNIDIDMLKVVYTGKRGDDYVFVTQYMFNKNGKLYTFTLFDNKESSTALLKEIIGTLKFS